MTEQEAVAYIEEWDVIEAAKVLKWYEKDELLRPCDCDTIVAIETEDLEAENAKLREKVAMYEGTPQEEVIECLRGECVDWEDKYRMLAAENAKLRELILDVADVLEENAKLRELAERLRTQLADVTVELSEQDVDLWDAFRRGGEWVNASEYRKLMAENAKLRELLLDVWNDAMQFDGFWNYVNDDGEIYNEDELPHYQERMRELGVEVDE